MYSKRTLRFGIWFVPLVAGCYSETPLTTPVPAPETRIVAQVTDSGDVAMGNALGPGAVKVEGVIAAADADAWRLRMVRVDYRGGTSTLWNRELVSFPRSTLANPTQKRLDKQRTWLAAGLITGTALLAARLFGAVGGGANPETQPPPPN